MSCSTQICWPSHSYSRPDHSSYPEKVSPSGYGDLSLLALMRGAKRQHVPFTFSKQMEEESRSAHRLPACELGRPERAPPAGRREARKAVRRQSFRQGCATHDLVMPSLPRHHQPNPGHAPNSAATALGALARAAPERHEQTIMSFEKTAAIAVPVSLFASTDTASLI